MPRSRRKPRSSRPPSNRPAQDGPGHQGRSILWTAASAAIVIAALQFGESLLVPLLVSGFLAVTCLPAVVFLKRVHMSETALRLLRQWKVPSRWVDWIGNVRLGTGIAVTLVVALLVFAFAGLGYLLGSSFSDFQERIRGYGSGRLAVSDEARDAFSRVHDASEFLGVSFSMPPAWAPEGAEGSSSESAGTDTSLNDVAAEAVVRNALDGQKAEGEPESVPVDRALIFQLATKIVAGVQALISNTLLVLLAVAMILLEAAGFPAKLRRAIGNPTSDLDRAREMIRKVERYLAMKAFVSLITGILAAVLCWACDVPFPVLWGFVAFLLNFIPTIGSIIAAFPPVLLSFVEASPLTALLVLAGYFAINTGVGNVLEPQMMGKRLGLSPLVVFLSMVFWGWMWGVVGMFLSVPLTMSVKIFLESTSDLRWLAVLMEGNPPEPETAAVAAATAATAAAVTASVTATKSPRSPRPASSRGDPRPRDEGKERAVAAAPAAATDVAHPSTEPKSERPERNGAGSSLFEGSDEVESEGEEAPTPRRISRRAEREAARRAEAKTRANAAAGGASEPAETPAEAPASSKSSERRARSVAASSVEPGRDESAPEVSAPSQPSLDQPPPAEAESGPPTTESATGDTEPSPEAEVSEPRAAEAPPHDASSTTARRLPPRRKVRARPNVGTSSEISDANSGDESA